MKNFFLLALAGVVAQLVDGSLGMAYGVSSTTVLLAAGDGLWILPDDRLDARLRAPVRGGTPPARRRR